MRRSIPAWILVICGAGCGPDGPYVEPCSNEPPGGEPFLLAPGTATTIAVSTDGRSAAALVGEQLVLVGPDGTAQTIALGTRAWSAAFLPSTGTVLAGTAGELTPGFLVDADGSVRPLATGAWSAPPIFSPDGTAAILHWNGVSEIVGPNGSRSLKPVPGGTVPDGIDEIAAEGRRILVHDYGWWDFLGGDATSRPAGWYVGDVERGTWDAFVAAEDGAAGVHLVDDGRAVLAARPIPADTGPATLSLTLVPVATGDPDKAPRQLGQDVDRFIVSPDGRSVLLRELVREAGMFTGQRRHRVVSLSGGRDLVVPTAPDDCEDCAAFSPDGALLANRNPDFDLDVIDLASGRVQGTLPGQRWIVTWDAAGLVVGDPDHALWVRTGPTAPLRFVDDEEPTVGITLTGRDFGHWTRVFFSNDGRRFLLHNSPAGSVTTDAFVAGVRMPARRLAAGVRRIVPTGDLRVAAWQQQEVTRDSLLVARTCGGPSKSVVFASEGNWDMLANATPPLLLWTENGFGSDGDGGVRAAGLWAKPLTSAR